MFTENMSYNGAAAGETSRVGACVNESYTGVSRTASSSSSLSSSTYASPNDRDDAKIAGEVPAAHSAHTSPQAEQVAGASTSHEDDEYTDADFHDHSDDAFAMRPPTRNSRGVSGEQSYGDQSQSVLEAAAVNPLAEPALELYISHDGVTVGDAVQLLRQLGLVLPSGFSMNAYFAPASSSDDDDNDGSKRHAPMPSPSTALSPEEWLCVVRDVWAATQPDAKRMEPSPQPALYGVGQGTVVDADRDADHSPTFVDTTAEKKMIRRASVSFDHIAGPLALEGAANEDGVDAHYTSNATSRPSEGGADVSDIQPSTTSAHRSDRALLLGHLFPSDKQENDDTRRTTTGAAGAGRSSSSGASAPSPTPITVPNAAAVSTPTAMVPAPGRSAKVMSREDAARELFVVIGAIPLRPSTTDGANPGGASTPVLHLTLGGWEHTLRLHNHNKLPPAPIVEDATRTITVLAAAAASTPVGTPPSAPAALLGTSFGSATSLSALLATTGGHRLVAFGPFYACLMDQLRQVMGDYANGHFTNDITHQRTYCFPDAPPPSLCVVLAAIAPTEMELLAGAPALAYLRAVGTVDAAMRALVVALEEEIVQRVRAAQGLVVHDPGHNRHISARGHSLVAADRTRPISASSRGPALAEELNWRNEQLRALTGTSQASRPISASLTSSLHSSGPRHRRPGSALSKVTSRFREKKPLDEISASVVARAKARRLLDALRRQTVPINRYEWYVRAEAEASPLDTNFVSGLNDGETDSTDSDAMPNMEETLMLKMSPRAASASARNGHTASASPLSSRVVAPDRHDTSNLYRLGGVMTVSVTPVAHTATFERLSKPRCDPRLLSGVARAPRLSAARREAVLKRRQARQSQPPQMDAGASRTSQDTPLPPPRLYAVPSRSQPAAPDTRHNHNESTPTSVQSSATATATTAAVATAMTNAGPPPSDERARGRIAPNPPVAYELSYGSVEDGAEDVAMGAPKRPPGRSVNRDTSAHSHRRRRPRLHPRPGPAAGADRSLSSSAQAPAHQSRHRSPRRARQVRARSRRRSPDGAVKGAGWAPYRVSTSAGATGASYSVVDQRGSDGSSETGGGHAPRMRGTKGTRRSTRRQVRTREAAQPAWGAVEKNARPSDDPYPYMQPAHPSHAFRHEVPPVPDRNTHHDDGDAATHGLSTRPHPKHSHGVSSGSQATASQASRENLAKFEHHVMRRFSNTGDPINDGKSPVLSSDTSRASSPRSSSRSSSSSSSCVSYASASADYATRNATGTEKHRRQTSPTQRERKQHAMGAVVGGDTRMQDTEHCFSTSFPSRTMARVSRDGRHSILPRRVLAPLLAGSSSRMQSAEQGSDSASRVEPLNPLLFTASSVGASGGRPPLTPMGPSAHRRLST